VWLLAACVACSHARGVVEQAQVLPSPPASVAVREPTREDVIAFCEQYRRALEARDADALVALASPRYDSEGVTYATLSMSLKRTLLHTDQIRYEIIYGDVTPHADGTITVTFNYTASFTTKGQTRSVVDDTEMLLERHGASFRILSGM